MTDSVSDFNVGYYFNMKWFNDTFDYFPTWEGDTVYRGLTRSSALMASSVGGGDKEIIQREIILGTRYTLRTTSLGLKPSQSTLISNQVIRL